MKAGDIVRFKKPFEDETGLLFVLMDDPAKVLAHIEQFKAKHPTWQAPHDWVDIKLLRDRNGKIQQAGPFTPIQSVSLAELELVAEVPQP